MQSIIALQFAAIFVAVRKGAYKNHKNVAPNPGCKFILFTVQISNPPNPKTQASHLSVVVVEMPKDRVPVLAARSPMW